MFYPSTSHDIFHSQQFLPLHPSSSSPSYEPETDLDDNTTNTKDNLYIHEKKYKTIADKIKVSSRTYFKHRNLIKKVKTNCINIYEKILNSCLHINQPLFTINTGKNKRKRDVLRYFKCDISKLRNYLLLNIPMKEIVSLFSDFQINDNAIIKGKKHKVMFLLNMTWKEFMLAIKNNVKEIVQGMENVIKITKKDFDIFFNYVLEINYSYDLRPSVDSLYANSLDKILNEGMKYKNEEELKRETNEFILMFNGF